MVTRFKLIDAEGKAIANGEIDGGVYRVFVDDGMIDHKEFDTLEEMLAECGGMTIQEEMFQMPSRTRQLGLFQGGCN